MKRILGLVSSVFAYEIVASLAFAPDPVHSLLLPLERSDDTHGSTRFLDDASAPGEFSLRI